LSLAVCLKDSHFVIADADIIFLSCFYISFFFPRLIAALADWMSTILLHMVWP